MLCLGWCHSLSLLTTWVGFSVFSPNISLLCCAQSDCLEGKTDHISQADFSVLLAMAQSPQCDLCALLPAHLLVSAHSLSFLTNSKLDGGGKYICLVWLPLQSLEYSWSMEWVEETGGWRGREGKRREGKGEEKEGGGKVSWASYVRNRQTTLVSFHDVRIYWITINTQTTSISLMLIFQVLLILLGIHEQINKHAFLFQC